MRTASAPARFTTRPSGQFVVALGFAGVFLAAMPTMDLWTWRHIRMDGVYNHDWGRLLRIAGFAPTWLVGAAVLMLARSGQLARDGWRRVMMPGLALVASVAAAGLLGELVKLVVRRARPGPYDGAYAFVPWDGHWSTGAIGLPSTHAIVAFAAAFALMRLSPRSGPVWLLIGLGCGLTRLLDGAHFLSDIVAAAVLAWATVAFLWEALRPERVELS